MNTSQRHFLIVQLAHVTVVVLVIVCSTLLAVDHVLPADAVVGLLGSALGTSGATVAARTAGRAAGGTDDEDAHR